MEINNGKPWCCYCNEGGNGRIIFSNTKGEIVDNPFCDKHMQVVCKHTVRQLKQEAAKFNKEPKFIVESWRWGLAGRPNLPNYATFMSRHYVNVSRYQKMIETEHFEYAF